jgi:phospholipase/carboxylesterase
MNRIQHLIDSLGISGESHGKAVEAGKITVPGKGSSPALFGPLHYEPNYAYPLILWLHGPGDDQRQLKRIMPHVSMRNYVAVGPRGTLAAPTASGRTAFDWSQSESQIVEAEQRVLASITAAKSAYHISPSRVFIAGFDTGGTMALRIACSHPDLFGGVLSLCGAFPQGHAPLSRLAEVRRLPVLLATGRDSRTYPPEQVCQDLRLFYAAGMSISLRQYPCGHELTTQMLSDVDRWIMEQITAPAVASPDCSGQNARES